jgi:ketosteroid isomerase-like protein
MRLISTFCSRFEAEDARAFAGLFTDDATYWDSLYGVFRGREAIQAFHGRCHREAKTFHFQPMTILSDKRGNVSFEWEFSFISLMPQSRGRKISLKGASFLTTREDRIVSYREYADSIALLLQGNIPDEELLAFYRRKYR